jgi:cytochrome bd-type quinol oxidase subunit 1
LVSAASGLFSLIGFIAIYTLLSVLFVALVGRELRNGPEGGSAHDY